MIEWINEITGMHEVASKHGHVGNHMLGLIHWFMAVLFVGWTAFLGVILYKFRSKKNPNASYQGVNSHFPSHLEVRVVIAQGLSPIHISQPTRLKRVTFLYYPTPRHNIHTAAH